MLLYPPNTTEYRGVWELVSARADATVISGRGALALVNGVVSIRNKWRCPTEERCDMWISVTTGDTESELVLGPTSGFNDSTAAWTLTPAPNAPGESIFFLQSMWKGPPGSSDSPDKGFGQWVGVNGTQLVLVPTDDLAARTAFRFVAASPGPSSAYQYCVSAQGVPEQINIQIASGDTVVISWVTFVATTPTKPPSVVVRRGKGRLAADPQTTPSTASTTVAGVTHVHTTTGGRIYYMHFVRLSGLDERAPYTYTVQSGGAGATVSDSYTFRAPYTSGVTRIDIFGDMGVYEWNNMEWLRRDCSGDAGSSSVDLIMHLGDHAYNEADADERRADGYMSAYQQTLSECPWLPVVGNHEWVGMNLARYLNSTWEGWGNIKGGNVPGTGRATGPAGGTATITAAAGSIDGGRRRSDASTRTKRGATAPSVPQSGSEVPTRAKRSTRSSTGRGGDTHGGGGGGGNIVSTATSALGKLLSLGNHHGSGTGGSTPSNTSRYFSVDFGLVHLISLDFNLYYGMDDCGAPCKQAQLQWLTQDLAAAAKNRGKVPWILASSHYPIYCTGCGDNFLKSKVSAAYYASQAAEYYGNGNVSASRIFDAAHARYSSAANTDAHTTSRDAASGTQHREITPLPVPPAPPPVPVTPPHAKRLGGASADLITDMQPLLNKYGVDLFVAGHWHYYESLWPGTKGTADCPNCLQPLAKDFNNPRGTVHVTTGNGGPPGVDDFHEHCPGGDCNSIPATRMQSIEYGYGRLTIHNASTLEFAQHANVNGSVIDSFILVQSSHGPFD